MSNNVSIPSIVERLNSPKAKDNGLFCPGNRQRVEAKYLPADVSPVTIPVHKLLKFESKFVSANETAG